MLRLATIFLKIKYMKSNMNEKSAQRDANTASVDDYSILREMCLFCGIAAMVE